MAIAALALWFVRHQTLTGIDEAMCRRLAADARSVGTAVENYKTDFGNYPATMDIQDLARAVEPKYIRSLPDYGHLDYFSDGESYAVFVRWGQGDQVINNCIFEFRDGEFLSWPEQMGWEQ